MNVRTSIFDPDAAKRLTIVRKMTKLQQKQFGALLGYGHQRYCSFESGRCAIPFYVINLTAKTVRLFGVVVTADWIISGQGEEPYFIESFNEDVSSVFEKTSQDPLTHFFLHALAISKIYKEKLTLFEGGTDYEPHIPAGTFILAPKVHATLFNPTWKGYYLVEHNEKVLLASLVCSAPCVFNITSLHASEKKRVHIKDHPLSHIYPATGMMSHYTLSSSETSGIVKIIQQNTQEYASALLETEDV